MAVVLLSAMLLLPAAWAQPGGRQGPPTPPRGGETHRHGAEPHRGRVTPGEAARHAQRVNGGGRVLSVMHANGGYRVKLIKNGEVRVVFVAGG